MDDINMKITCDAKELHKAIAACAKACEKDGWSLSLCKVLLVVNAEGLTITALDGARMIQKRVLRTSAHHEIVEGACRVHPKLILSAITGYVGSVTLEFRGNTLCVTTKWMEALLPASPEPVTAADKHWPDKSKYPTSVCLNAKLLADVIAGVAGKESGVIIHIPKNPDREMILIEGLNSSARGVVAPIRRA